MFGVAVNFYQSRPDLEHVGHSLQLALSLLKRAPEVAAIVVTDGSAAPNERMRRYCEERGIEYLHFGRELTFAEGYNFGIARLTNDYVCAMASDIYVRHDTFRQIKALILAMDPDTIGAVIPYLSHSDLPGQSATMAGEPCLSPLMTLNLNVFPRDVLQQVGGISAEFSGCYNDFMMAKRITDLGRRIYLADAFAIHYGGMTTASGTRVDGAGDRARVMELGGARSSSQPAPG